MSQYQVHIGTSQPLRCCLFFYESSFKAKRQQPLLVLLMTNFISRRNGGELHDEFMWSTTELSQCCEALDFFCQALEIVQRHLARQVLVPEMILTHSAQQITLEKSFFSLEKSFLQERALFLAFFPCGAKVQIY